MPPDDQVSSLSLAYKGALFAICVATLTILSMLRSELLWAQDAANCQISDLTRVKLKNLESKDSSSRISAARDLVESWQASLPGLMEKIAQFKHEATQDAWPKFELQHATLVTDIVKTILANHNQAIVLFRRCDSVRVIKPLIWAARGNDQALRINATSILANVLDNTTVCFALHHLRDPNISASGRINLLGASAAVAGYAYKENVIAMTSVLELLAKNSGKDVSQTMKLANELQGRIQRSANRDTPIPASLGSDCKAYKYDSQLD